MKDVRPNPLGRPAHEAIIERFARAVDRRRVRPTTAGLQHMNDAADHPPVIHPGHAPRVRGQKRLQARKLVFTEPEIVVRHASTPNMLGQRSTFRDSRKPLYGSGA